MDLTELQITKIFKLIKQTCQLCGEDKLKLNLALVLNFKVGSLRIKNNSLKFEQSKVKLHQDEDFKCPTEIKSTQDQNKTLYKEANSDKHNKSFQDLLEKKSSVSNIIIKLQPSKTFYANSLPFINEQGTEFNKMGKRTGYSKKTIQEIKDHF